jgi:hypothetical protein
MPKPDILVRGTITEFLLVQCVWVYRLELLLFALLLLTNAGLQFLLFLASAVQRLMKVFLEIFNLHVAFVGCPLYRFDAVRPL